MISQNIKVLFDAHNLGKKAGGIETYNRNLIKKLKKEKKLNIYLYTNSKTKHPPKKDVFVPLIDNGAYRIFLGFRRAIKKFNLDIIHCNNFLPLPAPKKVKKVITIHDLCFLEEKNLLSRIILAALLRFSLKNADRVIAVSNFTKKQISAFLGKKSINFKTSVIYHGSPSSLKSMNKKLAKKFVYQKYEIEDNYLLVSGNMTPRKNLPLIISLSNYLKILDASLKIIISGKKPNNNISQPKNIVFLDFVPDTHLNYLYNASLAVLLPSACEGFGLPVIEAASTKTPVIASPILAVKEIAKDTVWYAQNEKEWIRAVKKVIDGDYPKSLINKAYKNSLRFTWEKTAKETLKVYEKVISKTI